MTDRVLAHMGEDATIRSSESCRVSIERGVAVDTEIGDDKFVRSEFAGVITLANIPKSAAPIVGDSLTLTDSGEVFTVDAIIADNGFIVRAVLR